MDLASCLARLALIPFMGTVTGRMILEHGTAQACVQARVQPQAEAARGPADSVERVSLSLGGDITLPSSCSSASNFPECLIMKLFIVQQSGQYVRPPFDTPPFGPGGFLCGVAFGKDFQHQHGYSLVTFNSLRTSSMML